MPSKIIKTKYNFFSTSLFKTKYNFFFKNFFFCKFLKFLLKRGLKIKSELFFLKSFMNTKSILLHSSFFFFCKVVNKKTRKTKFFKSFKYFLCHQIILMNLLYFSGVVKYKKNKFIKLKKHKHVLFQKKILLNLFKFLICAQIFLHENI